MHTYIICISHTCTVHLSRCTAMVYVHTYVRIVTYVYTSYSIYFKVQCNGIPNSGIAPHLSGIASYLSGIASHLSGIASHLTPVTPEASTRIAKEVRWLLKQVTSELLEGTSSLSRPLMDHPPTLRGRESAGSRDNMPCCFHVAHTERDAAHIHSYARIYSRIFLLSSSYILYKVATINNTKQGASGP